MYPFDSFHHLPPFAFSFVLTAGDAHVAVGVGGRGEWGGGVSGEMKSRPGEEVLGVATSLASE